MPTAAQVINLIGAGPLTAIAQAQITYRAVGPQWELDNDARAAWFTGAKKVLILTQLDLHLLAAYISDLNWWATTTPSFNPADVPDVVNESEVLYKWWTVHMIHAQLEEAIRRITEEFEPIFMSKQRSISAVTSHLCSQLSLHGYRELFRLAHTIRNTIHNGGVFRPNDGKPVQIKWKHQTFNFEVDKRIDFITWDSVCDLINDLCDAMCAIVTSTKISKLTQVTRLVS